MAISQYVLFTILGAELPAGSFLQQIRLARARHMALAISGALLFDGESLLCLLEGEPTALAEARRALEQGLPSAAWQLLQQEPAASGRLLPGWRVGYTEPDLLQALCAVLAKAAELAAQAQALAAFVQLLEASDPQ